MYQQYNINRRRQNGCSGCGCFIIIIIFMILISAVSIMMVFKSSGLLTDMQEKESLVYQEDEYGVIQEGILSEQQFVVDSVLKSIENKDFEIFNHHFSESTLELSEEKLTAQQCFDYLVNEVNACYGENPTINPERYETEKIQLNAVDNTMVYCYGSGTGSKGSSDFKSELLIKEIDGQWKVLLVNFEKQELFAGINPDLPNEDIVSFT